MRYEFKERDAFDFRNHVNIPAKQFGDELRFRECPYCHGGKNKDRDTFSINTRTGQFECKRSSCSIKGNMVTLARDFNFSLGTEFDNAIYNRKKYRTFTKKEVVTKDEAINYLQKRGISEATTRKYEITVQEKNKNILVFPFFDENSILRFVKYRKIDFDKTKDKNKEWCEENCMPILFGMKQCDGTFDRLVITEGQIDSLTLAECGIKNAVSVPTGKNGFTWIPNNWNWFSQFKELVVFGDCENNEITLSEELRKRFPNTLRIVKFADYRGCKDANELFTTYGKEAVISAVNNAELAPIKRVKPLEEVEAVDIYSMPRIYTNISELDKLLGGLYFGQIILLTGKRGDGKSTFMSQLAIEAIEQNFPIFVYSGELLDFYFKRWMDMQVAGPKHIIASQQGKYESYSITNTNVDKINAWYKGKAFLYDNNCIEDDEMEDLIKTTEKAIQQYGIKLVCIDNLMTALDVDINTDLYRAQSKFVGKLAKIAKIYNVVIILVAHPRKSKDGFVNDDVSGSADITNKVDVVMSYCRTDVYDEDHRVLKITKNRLTGRLTKKDKEINLYYSQSSKRIVGIEKDFNREYGWNTDNDGFIEIAENEELPFM